jgi:hypothetical protein
MIKGRKIEDCTRRKKYARSVFSQLVLSESEVEVCGAERLL